MIVKVLFLISLSNISWVPVNCQELFKDLAKQRWQSRAWDQYVSKSTTMCQCNYWYGYRISWGQEGETPGWWFSRELMSFLYHCTRSSCPKRAQVSVYNRSSTNFCRINKDWILPAGLREVFPWRAEFWTESSRLKKTEGKGEWSCWPRTHPFISLTAREGMKDLRATWLVSMGCQQEEMENGVAWSQIPKDLGSCAEDLECDQRGNGNHRAVWPSPVPLESPCITFLLMPSLFTSQPQMGFHEWSCPF